MSISKLLDQTISLKLIILIGGFWMVVAVFVFFILFGGVKEGFKAGIAGGPVCDWSMYEVMYTERYMDTPESNADGFEKANLVNKVDQLTDNLLVIHGTVDNVVVWQNSQALLKAAVDNEIQLDYFVYPGHPHNVQGKDRVHLMRKVLDYAADKIGPGTK